LLLVTSFHRLLQHLERGMGPTHNPLLHLFLILPFRNCLRTDLHRLKSQMHLQASNNLQFHDLVWAWVSCVCVFSFSFALVWERESDSAFPYLHVSFPRIMPSQQMNKLLGGFGIFLKKKFGL
jgi:hypothetical protein